MIRLEVLAVGKLKEQWMRDGCAEYKKRIGLWGGVNINEVDEYRLPENPSNAIIEDGIEKESARLRQKIPKGARIIALCIEGREMSSEELATYLEKSAVDGCGSIAFLIGGSNGLSDSLKKEASLCFSMSRMTFPHQLARVMLLEQLYRALSIQANTKYHK